MRRTGARPATILLLAAAIVLSCLLGSGIAQATPVCIGYTYDTDVGSNEDDFCQPTLLTGGISGGSCTGLPPAGIDAVCYRYAIPLPG